MNSFSLDSLQPNPHHKKILRWKILNEILIDLSVNDQQLARSLTHLHLALESSDTEIKGLSSQLVLMKIINDAVETRLSEEIESKLLSISEFLSGGSVDSDNIPNEITRDLENIASLESDLSSSWSSSTEMIACIEQLHTHLQSALLDAISAIPPVMNERHIAADALSAATIEASLVKLSLLRTQSYQKLYGFASDTNPDATMSSSLSSAYVKLQEECSDLIKEEKLLDSQIDDYERLMRLVDGGARAGFAQIVEDYIRVENETEECRRDLRRLGWTGD